MLVLSSSPEFEPARELMSNIFDALTTEDYLLNGGVIVPGIESFSHHEIGQLSSLGLVLLYISNLLNPLYFTYGQMGGVSPKLKKITKTLVQFDWAIDYTLISLVASSGVLLSWEAFGPVATALGMFLGTLLPRKNSKGLIFNIISAVLISNIIMAGWPAITIFINLSFIHLLFDTYLGVAIGNYAGKLGFITLRHDTSTNNFRIKETYGTSVLLAGAAAAVLTVSLTWFMTSFSSMGIITLLGSYSAYKIFKIFKKYKKLGKALVNEAVDKVKQEAKFELNPKKKDSALLIKSSSQKRPDKAGGINLYPDWMNLKIKEQQREHFDPVQFEKILIDSFIPNILQIIPINDIKF